MSWLRSKSNKKILLNVKRTGDLKIKHINSNKNSDQKDDIVSQITNLAKLKEQGIITEEEFQQGKLKILS